MEALLPFLGPLITGGSSLLGSLFSSSTSASNTQAQIQNQQALQQQSEQFNAGQAQISRDYSTEMSNTAYQRASADMKAAGLNPMIMAGGGGGASTPSPATASTSTPTAPTPQKTSPLAGLGEAAKVAMTTAVQQKEMDKVAADTANTKLRNDDLTRQLAAGAPEKNVERTQSEITESGSRITKNEQDVIIRAFEERTGRLFKSLSPAEQDALIIGKKTLDTAGDVVGLGAKGAIGKFLSGNSAKSPTTPSPVNSGNSATTARNILNELERNKTSVAGKTPSADTLRGWNNHIDKLRSDFENK